MQLIKHNLHTIEENLALDEHLLLKAEEGRYGETLRFWSSDDYCVVVGRAGKISEECVKETCEEDGIRVLRRISGGGTVLQGPGCINFSLILFYNSNNSYLNTTDSYKYILGEIASELRSTGLPVEVMPISDIIVNGRKISGNAQCRKKQYFLHHGTILLDMDAAKIQKYLKHPPQEPAYRQNRPHEAFISNTGLTGEEAIGIVKKAFPVDGDIVERDIEDIEQLKQLVEIKYTNPEWTYAFS
jgi:lipoate---protein ligase